MLDTAEKQEISTREITISSIKNREKNLYSADGTWVVCLLSQLQEKLTEEIARLLAEEEERHQKYPGIYPIPRSPEVQILFDNGNVKLGRQLLLIENTTEENALIVAARNGSEKLVITNWDDEESFVAFIVFLIALDHQERRSVQMTAAQEGVKSIPGGKTELATNSF